VLSIAGSDSGGGAGIQADLKAFAACGVHGMTAITALTAQNTVSVDAVHPVPGEMIMAQVRAVVTDIGVDAVKIGMLGTEETIRAVAGALDELLAGVPVVLDPVMVAESGAELLEPGARRALVELILPRATVVTPNVPEARVLARVGAEAGQGPGGAEAGPGPGGAEAGPGLEAGEHADPALAAGERETAELARAVRQLGPRVVVITGGHREQAIDLFYDGRRMVEIPGPRHPDGAAHGSGCTHSSVLAARLAWGDDPLQAARVAKQLASRAVADGLVSIGAGAGPVNVLGLAIGARDSVAGRRSTGG
jgi:hydroxymethylpyrimidine/phosphomethylpyrimidine kinase